MKSGMSFFNSSVLKKDIFRFAPVWGLYTVYLLYTHNIQSGVLLFESFRIESMYWLIRIEAFPLVIYAFICATTLFGDLFTPRLCNALHAMPLRRETWFFTHVAAGLLFAFVPHTVAALLMMPLLGQFAGLAWMWWLGQNGAFLFLFGLAVLCVMCAGNRMGHAVSYLLIGFLPLLVCGIYNLVYASLLQGINADLYSVEILSPLTVLSREYFIWQYTSSAYIYQGLNTKDWLWLAGCAVLSVGLFAGALALYRRRQLEWASDFLPHKALQWTLLIFGSFYTAILIPVAGFFLAFFLIRMLQERTVKVFHRKNWRALGLLTALAAFTIGLTLLDPLGVESYIPKEAQIEKAFVGYNEENADLVLTDPESIRLVQQLHQYAIEEQEDTYDSDQYVLNLNYRMKSGWLVRRRYTLPGNDAALHELKLLLSSTQVVMGVEEAELENAVSLRMSFYKSQWYDKSRQVDLPQDENEAILACLKQDSQAGLLAQDKTLHHDSDNIWRLQMWIYTENGLQEANILVFEGSATYEYLKTRPR